MSKNKNNTVLKIHKPQPKYPVMKEIKNRFSPRFFASKKVKNKDVKTMLEAARWAPSGHNTQPWKFKIDADNRSLQAVGYSWPADSTGTFRALNLRLVSDSPQIPRVP